MWMISPELMCTQHILGEHRELHALKGSIERTKPKYDNHEKHRKNLTTLAEDALIELESLKERHEELVKHIDNHNSPIGEIPTLEYLPKKVRKAKVDKEKSKLDLIDRPEACKPEGCCKQKLGKFKINNVTEITLRDNLETLVICKSIHHGNTEAVGKSIAKVIEADLREPERTDVEEVREKDLVGFGSGIYHGSFHESIFDFIEKLPEVEGKKAFIFSTSGLPKIPIFHDFEDELKEKLTDKGFEVIGSFSCRGWDTYISVFDFFGGIHKGRPNEGDLEEAKKFAKKIS